MKPLMLLAAAALLVAGCGTPSDGGDEFTVPPMEDGKYVIEMTSDFAFVPQNAKVPVGATVLWKHTGGDHNAVSDDGAWEAGKIGDDFELEVTEAMLGKNKYHCDPHESLGMTGVLLVVESLE